MHLLRLSAALSLVCLLSACGPTSVSSARTLATNDLCDRLDTCGEIGPGRSYPDRETCEAKVRNFWTDQWPSSDTTCENGVEQEELDNCLVAIRTTQCGNGFDMMNTLFNRCSREAVCGR